MLEKLSIKNYLIIKEAELEFSEGLNILTGETGAGKTIILDALSLILGERADYSIIKKNKEKLVIEGHFQFDNKKNVLEFLKEYNLLTDSFSSQNIVVLRRELTKKGISRNFINDIPVAISQLKSFGDLIIDIHSQNEHQSLLKKESHIKLLDNFIGNKKLLADYRNSFNEYEKLLKNYEELKKKKNNIIERKNFIEFQLKEINNVNLQKGEEEQLENELNKIENMEDISLSLNNSLEILYEKDNNVIAALSTVVKEIKKIVKYDSELINVLEDLESSYVSVKEITEILNSYNNSINFDSVKIEQIRGRLGSINFIKKKYNLSEPEIIKKARELQKELDYAENFDYEIEELKQKIKKSIEELYNKASRISSLRNSLSTQLVKNVNLYFKEIGLETAEFKVENKVCVSDENTMYIIKKKSFYVKLKEDGIDDVEFIVKINKGAEFTPLRKTASGGEVSRIMLAIKASVTGKDEVPVLVFDEIDSGISGRIADKVGKVLKQLSKSHQIISITHLPQIAAMSDKHFRVSKEEDSEETIAKIKTLTEQEKVTEIAKLLSGEKITEASTKSAKELISNN
ncbi:DNA repair protein RecN [Bacteroidota bacterium]